LLHKRYLKQNWCDGDIILKSGHLDKQHIYPSTDGYWLTCVSVQPYNTGKTEMQRNYNIFAISWNKYAFKQGPNMSPAQSNSVHQKSQLTYS
jgi:hypothetical protein